MRIKFKGSDPRAGTIAQMDSHRGQELIDTGAAVKVSESAEAEAPAAAAKEERAVEPFTSEAPRKAAKKTAKKA